MSWIRNPSRTQKLVMQVLLTLASTLPLSYWWALYGDRNGAFATRVGDIGWSNVAAVVSIIAGVALIALPALWRSGAEAAYEKVVAPTMQTVFQVAIAAYQAAKPDMLINARYFAFSAENGQRLLKPVSGAEVMTDPMPGEFGLKAIDLDRDSYLVVSRAFAEESPVYVRLTAEDAKQYRPEIKTKIDPDQSWVLACPVLPEGRNEPRGVVCLYGRKTPAETGADERALKNVAVSLATAYARVLQGYDTLETSQ